MSIKIKENSIDKALLVNSTIKEFEDLINREYFKKRIKDKKKLIIIGYFDDKPAGYIVGYERDKDNSFYLWMGGVNPKCRRKGNLKALVNYTTKWSRKKGYTKLKAKTRNKHRKMFSYLIKYGFNLTKVEMMSDIKENNIHFEKEII